MKLSVIIIFFNNRREAPRTLYSLTRTYQRNIVSLDYEVLAIDSNSTEPLDAQTVESFGAEFSYHFVKTPHPSPVEALRLGVQASKGKYLMVIIDGAHMLSPNIFSKWQFAIKAYPASFVYTQRYHLGKYRQNDHKGYDQSAEDILLNNIDWKNDGYELFRISEFLQADEWWFSNHFESNCFIIPRKKLIEHGSIHKDYFSIGGGFLNMAMFKEAVEDPELTSVILMGESSFHQFHGGTTTNVTREEVKTKVNLYRKEYFDLNQSHYSRPEKNDVHYFGNIDEAQQSLLTPSKIQTHYRKITADLIFENKLQEAIFLIDRATELYPYSIGLLTEKIKIYKGQGRYDEALNILEKGLSINELDTRLLLLKGEIFLSKNDIDKAVEIFEFCHTADQSDPMPLMKLSKIYLKKGESATANQYIELAVKRVEETKVQGKFLNVFTFVKNNNYKSLAQKMIGFSDEISTLAYNFNFQLSKAELMKKGAAKSKLTNKLAHLYYYSKVNVNECNRLANLLIQQGKKSALWKLCDDLAQRKLIFYDHFFKAKWYLNRSNYNACLNRIADALSDAHTIEAKANCYNIRAKCRLQQEQFKRALQNAHKAVEINPNHTDFLFTKAKAHLGAKQNQRAKVLFERVAAISNYHFKFDSLLHLFDIDFNEGNYESCKHHLEKANTVKPNHARILKKQQKLATA